MAIINTRTDGVGQLIETLLNKEKLAQQKEALNLQKKEFQQRVEQQQYENQVAVRDRLLMELGARAAANSIGGNVASTAQSLPQGAATPFMNILPGAAETMARTDLLGEQTRVTRAQGDVAEATIPDLIRQEQLQTDLLTRQATTEELEQAKLVAETEGVKAATRGRQLDSVYQALQNERDPVRVGQARALWETGQMTWGQAREVAGLAASDLMDDNTIYVAPAGTAQNAEAAKAMGFARMMQTGAGIIDALETQGVRLAPLSSLMRQTQSPTFDAFANALLSSEQRRYVNAQRLFGDAYRFSLSGQQSSDREALRMLNSVAPQTGDDAATLAQKKLLRDTMIEVTRLKAAGAISGVEAAQQGLRAAKNTDNDKTIELFEEILSQAVAAQENNLINNGPAGASAFSDDNLNRLMSGALTGNLPPGG